MDISTNNLAEGETSPAAGGGEHPPAGGRSDEQRPGNDRPQHDVRTTTVRLPFVTARFETPRPQGGRLHVGRLTFPSPGKAVYYVGLGALAVAEVIEWPIAVAIGAGTYIAQHTRADEAALPHLEPAHAERREPVGEPA